MASQYDLPYTGNQVETLLGKVSELEEEMPEKVSDLQNDAGYITQADVPTDVSELNNDAGYITNAPVVAEQQRAAAAEGAIGDRVTAIEGKIPSAASSSNQLADKNFVNSSIATASATHQGTYNLVTDLGLTVSATTSQVAAAIATKMTALGKTPDNNDYVFVQVPTGNDTPTEIARIDRYKYNGSEWGFEYSLNNSGFTAAQWAAINSGITSADVTKLSALPTDSELAALFAGKQDVIDDLATIRAQAAAAYVKPSGGIPSTDMSSAVQTSLGKADTAVQDVSGKADKDTDAVEGNVAKFDENGNPVDAGYSAMRIHRDLGYNAAQSIIALTAGETGKYVKCSTRSAVANANFNISAPFNVDACSELLIKTGYNPSDNAHASLDISVIAIYEEMERTRTVQAKDGNNNPLYYEVDEDGNPTSTQTTTVTPYPVYTTETYTEHRYLPNNEDRFVAIPDSGYYVANIPQSCKCVVSYKPGVTDTTVIIVKHGALANLTSQIFGIYEHRTMAEAVTSLAYRIAALESRIQRPGNIEVGSIDAIDITRYRHPQVLTATGVPSASLRPTNLADDIPWDGIPAFVGEFYFAQWKEGATTKVRLYFAAGIAAVADWLLIYSLN